MPVNLWSTKRDTVTVTVLFMKTAVVTSPFSDIGGIFKNLGGAVGKGWIHLSLQRSGGSWVKLFVGAIFYNWTSGSDPGRMPPKPAQ